MDRAAALYALASLDQHQLAAIAPALTPGIARTLRMALRNQAIRDAGGLVAHLPRIEGARVLAHSLRMYANGADWSCNSYRSDLPDNVPEARRVLHRVVYHGGGQAPKWRRIRDILDGCRG